MGFSFFIFSVFDFFFNLVVFVSTLSLMKSSSEKCKARTREYLLGTKGIRCPLRKSCRLIACTHLFFITLSDGKANNGTEFEDEVGFDYVRILDREPRGA